MLVNHSDVCLLKYIYRASKSGAFMAKFIAKKTNDLKIRERAYTQYEDYCKVLKKSETWLFDMGLFPDNLGLLNIVSAFGEADPKELDKKTFDEISLIFANKGMVDASNMLLIIKSNDGISSDILDFANELGRIQSVNMESLDTKESGLCCTYYTA